MSNQEHYERWGSVWRPSAEEEAAAATARGDTGTYSVTGLWTPGTTTQSVAGTYGSTYHIIPGTFAEQHGVIAPGGQYVSSLMPGAPPAFVPSSNAPGEDTVPVPYNLTQLLASGTAAAPPTPLPPATGPQQSPDVHGQPVAIANRGGFCSFNFQSGHFPREYVIRAYGRITRYTRVYHIINGADSSPAGTFVVDENKEIVELRDYNGLCEMSASKGLGEYPVVMKVSTPSNREFAYIEEYSIEVPTVSKKFVIQQHLIFGEWHSKVFDTHTPRQIPMAIVSTNEDIMRLSIRVPLSNNISAVMLLYALKISYHNHRITLHKLPMPYPIPGSLPVNSFPILQPMLRKLDEIRNLRLRLSGHVNKCNFFLDVLDPEGRVMLVASKVGFVVQFTDPAARPVFFAHMKNRKIDVLTPPPENRILGTTLNSEGFDAQNNYIMTLVSTYLCKTVINGKTKKLYRFDVVKADSDDWLAEFRADRSTVEITMNSKLHYEFKAIILAWAVEIAINHYEISEHISPKVTNYPFPTMSI